MAIQVSVKYIFFGLKARGGIEMVVFFHMSLFDEGMKQFTSKQGLLVYLDLYKELVLACLCSSWASWTVVLFDRPRFFSLH